MMKKADDVKARLQRKASVLKRVFAGPEGQEALEFLRQEFVEGPLFDKDPLVTAHRLGARDMVVFIQQLVRIGQ